ncbi:MAG: CapA family protein [Lachnospiraceae bacterium]|nr:CapA family protein [Lachnospiraceae bacterium]
MKKLAPFLLLLSILSLTACSKNQSNSSPQETESKAEESDITTVTWENEEEDNDDSIVINPIEDSASIDTSSDEDPTISTSAEQQTGGAVKLVFAGDMDFDDRYTNMIALRSRSNGILDCIGSTLVERMRNADICMINNEFPYSDRGTPLANKKFTFRAKPETAEFLSLLGVDIVSLANNHAYDHGKDALLDTFDTLTSNGIRYVGAGKNLSEAMTPQYFTINGTVISIVAATQIERSLPPDTVEATESSPGVLRTLDPEKFISVIKNAKANSDVCIVFVHWGSENKSDFESSQAELANAYVDAGADVILGAHPHVLQGFDYIGDVPVLYSMGNYWFNSKTLDTCLVELNLYDKRVESLQFIPCRQHDCKTEEMLPGTTQDYERILSDMRKMSTSKVNIDNDGFVTKK